MGPGSDVIEGFLFLYGDVPEDLDKEPNYPRSNNNSQVVMDVRVKTEPLDQNQENELLEDAQPESLPAANEIRMWRLKQMARVSTLLTSSQIVFVKIQGFPPSTAVLIYDTQIWYLGTYE